MSDRIYRDEHWLEDAGNLAATTPTPAPLTTDPDGGRAWAIRAARMDASFLISPRARARALEILVMEPLAPETRAAILILSDGGAQQGLEGYQFAPTMDRWIAAAETLGVSDV